MAAHHLLLLLAIAVFASTVDADKLLRSRRSIRTFRFQDCGGANAAIRFRRVSTMPRPIIVPGSIQVAINVDVLRNISGTMSADIQIARRLNFGWLGYVWLDITPTCPLGETCRTDLCAKIQSIVQSGGCPSQLIGNGFDCTCPPPLGSYVTRNDLPIVAVINESDLPHAMLRDLLTGVYKVRSDIFDGDGASIGCFEAQFGLQHRHRN